MHIKTAFLLLGVTLICNSQAWGFEDSGLLEPTSPSADETGTIRGIIFDRTITQTGLGFYQAFAQLWQTDNASLNHSLSIRETPTARYGSVIWIEEGSKLLHRVTIGQRNQELDKKAQESWEAIRPQLSVDNQSLATS